MAIYKIDLRGYKVSTDSIPEESGIYVVYRCKHNSENRTVSLKELVYIGRSNTSIKQDILQNEQRFKDKQQDGETICYSYCVGIKNNIDVIAKGLIFMQKPSLNDEEEKRRFDSSSLITNIIIEGKNNLFRLRRFSITKKTK